MGVPKFLLRGPVLAGAAIVAIGIYANITSPPLPPKPREKRAASLPSTEPPDWQRIVYAQRKIKERLRDPGSAQFGETRVSRKGGTPIVCGTVNSRNGFGGMTGNQRYMSGGAITALEEDATAAAMDDVWRQLC